jgi:hypothetical protein
MAAMKAKNEKISHVTNASRGPDPDKHNIQRHLLLALFTALEVGDATSQRSVVALDEVTHQFRTWLAHSMTLARWVRNKVRNDILVKTLSKNVRVNYPYALRD